MPKRRHAALYGGRVPGRRIYGVLAPPLFTAAVIRATGIPYRYFIRAMKPLVFLLLFILVFHIVYDAGAGSRWIWARSRCMQADWKRYRVRLPDGALHHVGGGADLHDPAGAAGPGSGRLLRPLTYIGVPTDRLVLMLGIALRFIPTIFEEAERLWKAQQSRGLDLSSRPLKEKARLIIALLVPVTTGAFRRAIGLADSMEARGYRLGARRSRFRAFVWKRADTLFVALLRPPRRAAVVCGLKE